MDTEQKLNILAESSRYDLACACKEKTEPGRIRGPEGSWIYPAALPSGRKIFLLKTLQTNACENDCSYCPFNHTGDIRRCTLEPGQLAETFMALASAGRVQGLFLSSGISSGPDATMARMLATVEILRKKHRFGGFVHLKVIPGASENAIERAIRLASRVSVNIESPTAEHLGRLSSKKRFHEDIISAMRTIERLRRRIKPSCSQTTQFVVGAAGESDHQIVTATDRLYNGYGLERVYFAAYQDTAGQSFGGRPVRKQPAVTSGDKTGYSDTEASFVREHRLYQVDFLFRRYGFSRDEIYFEPNGNLSLRYDPKQIWAERHPEFFPIDINRADRWQLLRVPGIGPTGANRIIKARKQRYYKKIDELDGLNIRLSTAGPYLKLAGKSQLGPLFDHSDDRNSQG